MGLATLSNPVNRPAGLTTTQCCRDADEGLPVCAIDMGLESIS